MSNYANVMLEDRVFGTTVMVPLPSAETLLVEVLNNPHRDYYFCVQFHPHFPDGAPLQDRVDLSAFRGRDVNMGPFYPNKITAGQAHKFLSAIGELNNYVFKFPGDKIIIPVAAASKKRSPER